MRTAIITGASSGLGLEYVRQLGNAFPEIECYWLVARREERLSEIKAELPDRISVKVLPLDLQNESSFTELAGQLASEKPDVRLLINCAGLGYLGNVAEMDMGSQARMTQVNVTALTAVTCCVLPYMSEGGRVINISSIASFCPNPRMTVYSSTKAYVSSFSRGLREELRPRGISVLAVCPGPMETEFLTVGNIKGNSKMFQTLPYCNAKSVAQKSLARSRRGKAVYTPRVFFKFYRVIAKLLPHSLVVKLAKT